MTSRTIVSPNSMIEWMSALSSPSMASSWAATSANASSSDSVMSGSVRSSRPPGVIRRASPIKAPDTTRVGGNLTSVVTSGAARRAARSE